MIQCYYGLVGLLTQCFHILILGVLVFKLLTMTRNNIGPRFVPWGTPAVTGSQLEIDLQIFTHCRLSVRKVINYPRNKGSSHSQIDQFVK